MEIPRFKCNLDRGPLSTRTTVVDDRVDVGGYTRCQLVIDSILGKTSVADVVVKGFIGLIVKDEGIVVVT